ncbi:MAG: AAA family ATPase [bacterium]
MNDSANNSNLPNAAAGNELAEIQKLLQMVQNNVDLPPHLREKALGMIYRLEKVIEYGSFSREFEPISEYINWITQIPWNKTTNDNLEITNVKTELDKTHYGLENVKERVVEFIAMMNLKQKNEAAVIQGEKDRVIANQTSAQAGQASAPVNSVNLSQEMSRLQGSSSHAPIICFVGVQGIGKTSIAKSIAGALGRKFVRISLGAIGGVTELRGRSKGEIDAEPGQVIKALIRTGVMNPLILIDEVDKVSSETGLRADVMAALLEILDPEQNSTFMDHFIDYPVDLSGVIFIATANNLGGISAALLDRLEIVRMSSYSDDEKLHIARDYLLPKVMQASGVLPGQISFQDAVWPLVIRPLGFDAGIRELERTITNLVRKVARKIVSGEGERFEISPENFREYIPEDIGVYS